MQHEREVNIVKGNRKNKHYTSTRGSFPPKSGDVEQHLQKPRQSGMADNK
jgi:hypothetical protein